VEETKLVKPTDKATVKDGERVTGLQRKWTQKWPRKKI